MRIPDSLKDLFSQFKRPRLYSVWHPIIEFDQKNTSEEILAQPNVQFVFKSNRAESREFKRVNTYICDYEGMVGGEWDIRTPRIVYLGNHRAYLLNPPSLLTQPFPDEQIHLEVVINGRTLARAGLRDR